MVNLFLQLAGYENIAKLKAENKFRLDTMFGFERINYSDEPSEISSDNSNHYR